MDVIEAGETRQQPPIMLGLVRVLVLGLVQEK
jgi:hypothetical protein